MRRRLVPIKGKAKFHEHIAGWKCARCGWEYSLQGSFTATGEVIGIIGSRSMEHAKAQREFSKHVCEKKAN